MNSVVNSTTQPAHDPDFLVEQTHSQTLNNALTFGYLHVPGRRTGPQGIQYQISGLLNAEIVGELNKFWSIGTKSGPLVSIPQSHISIRLYSGESRIVNRCKLKRLTAVRHILCVGSKIPPNQNCHYDVSLHFSKLS